RGEEGNEEVIGAATLVVERKLIHGGRRAGRIEDVVVDRRCRRRGIGRLLIERLCRLAAELGCYRVVLCCDPRNTGFYERCGFREHDVGMRLDIAD
ncbi:MAG: GNAT family N-acetyltransferase, partial [Planctomycetales bacterium]